MIVNKLPTFPHLSPYVACNRSPSASPNYMTSTKVPHDNQSATSYILYLEPSKTSSLREYLEEAQTRVSETFGADRSHCYEPHCSLTGFFPAPADADIVEIINEELKSFMHDHRSSNDAVKLPIKADKENKHHLYNSHASVCHHASKQVKKNSYRSTFVLQKPRATSSMTAKQRAKSYAGHIELLTALFALQNRFNMISPAPHSEMLLTCSYNYLRQQKISVPEAVKGEVTVNPVTCTPDGYVILPLECGDWLKNLINRIIKRVQDRCGVAIRQKRADHISLACNRSSEQQTKIAEAYHHITSHLCGGAPVEWDLVLSCLVKRSSSFECEGKHQFQECIRLSWVACSPPSSGKSTPTSSGAH